MDNWSIGFQECAPFFLMSDNSSTNQSISNRRLLFDLYWTFMRIRRSDSVRWLSWRMHQSSHRPSLWKCMMYNFRHIFMNSYSRMWLRLSPKLFEWWQTITSSSMRVVRSPFPVMIHQGFLASTPRAPSRALASACRVQDSNIRTQVSHTSFSFF